MYKQYLSFFFLSLLFFGCEPSKNNKVAPILPSDSNATYAQFVALNKFPYSAPKIKKEAILNNYSKLALGLNKSEVGNILGKPDYSETLYPKENSHPKPFGYRWVYCFEKQNPNIVNLKNDKEIVVLFNLNGKTQWISTNVEGLKDIGSPDSDK